MGARRSIVAVVGAVAAVAMVFVLAAPDASLARRCLPPLIKCQKPSPPPSTNPDGSTPIRPATALDLGLTERDPRLLIPSGPGARAARNVIALRPRYIRVLLSWDRVQPVAGRKPNWDAPPGGCPPAALSCKSALGLRSLLQAIKHRQEADGGWEVVVVPFYTPRWAGTKPSGCLRPGTTFRAYMPRIAQYRHFLRAFMALADKVGVRLPYWLAWNEPNHPAFLNPQRRICDPKAKALAPGPYAELVRAAAKEMRYDQQLVIGGLAGIDVRKTYAASAPEFIRGLPKDVACTGGPFAQHVYIGKRARRGFLPARANPKTAGATALIDAVDNALQSRGCSKQLWIAETGTFDRRCDSMAAALTTWAEDPRVDAAFQYTYRDSPAFPVGLASTTLRQTYGSYRAWLAFADATSVPTSPCG